MPSTSPKQHRFMEAIAHNPEFAQKAGVPQSVGKDFAAADKGKSFKDGGIVSMGHAPVPTMGVSSSQPPPPMNADIGNPASRPMADKRSYGKK